ncbi:hypothetical protein, partial [Bradyrhizobium viridifuturi]|uniref:hypothetical protein n=1 Tax=Bradyrhizobium viridifuturi TaxID=1654716 RepID=UPI001AEBDB78
MKGFGSRPSSSIRLVRDQINRHPSPVGPIFDGDEVLRWLDADMGNRLAVGADDAGSRVARKDQSRLSPRRKLATPSVSLGSPGEEGSPFVIVSSFIPSRAENF